MFVRHAHPVLQRVASHYKIKTTIKGPKDAALEPYLDAIRDAVRRKVAGMMIIGWGDPEAVPVVDDAIDSGIPVVTVDSDIPASKRLAHFGTDWYRMGISMADSLARMIDHKGKVLMLGLKGLANMETGFQGFISQMGLYPDIEILGPFDDLDIGTARAEALVIEYIDRHPDIIGIAGFDGNSGPGAASALEGLGLADRVKLVCVDAEDAQLDFLKKGVIDAAFCQKRESFTYLAFQTLYSYNHGSVVTRNKPGLVNIPGNIDLDHIVITQKNADTYMNELGLDDLFEKHMLLQQLALVDSMMENIAEVTLAADRKGRVVYANPASMTVTGYTAGEILNLSIYDLFHLNGDQVRTLTNVLSTGDPCSFEAGVRASDGLRFPVKMSISPLKAGQVVSGFVIVALEIIDLKNAEEKQKADLEYLQSALAAKTDFLSMVSHELRAPLVPIIGFSELLLDGTFGVLSSGVTESVTTINEKAESLGKLIDDLYNLAHIEQQAVILHKQPVSMHQLMKSIINDYRGREHNKTVSILHEGDEFILNIDSDRLRQVLSILIENSLRYSRDSVDILLQTHVDDQVGSIAVKDTGYGIKSDKLPHVFNRFYYADTDDKHPTHGSGLGLAIASELTALMGGSISVQSEFGKGSTFTITFPIVRTDGVAFDVRQVTKVQKREHSHPVQVQSQGTDGNPKVLIIDDDQAALDITRVMLGDGFDIMTAKSGAEGLEIIYNNHVDVILLDWVMPGMDGISVLVSIKASDVTKNIPVIFISGKTEKGSVQKVLKTGAVDYITKPFTRTRLLDSIEKIISAV